MEMPNVQPTPIVVPQKKVKIKVHKGRQAFFWGGYIVLLLISVPNMAYYFGAFGSGNWIETIVAYGIAIFIEAVIYICTYSIAQAIKAGFKKHWLVIIILTIFALGCACISFYTNFVHAAHFENNDMLRPSSGVIQVPFFSYAPVVASIWPFLGIIVTFASPYITRVYKEASDTDFDDDGVATVEDAQKRAEAIEAQTIVDLAEAKRQADLLKARTGGVIQAGLTGFREGFSKKEEQLPPPTDIRMLQRRVRGSGNPIALPTQANHYTEDASDGYDTDDEEEKDVQMLPAPTVVQKVQQQQEEQTIVLPLSDDETALSDSVSFPEEIQSVPAVSKDVELPIIPLFRPEIVQAKDVHYAFGTGKCTVDGRNFASLNKAFEGLTPKISREDLESLWNEGKLNVKACRVVMNGKTPVKVLFDHPQHHKKIVELVENK